MEREKGSLVGRSQSDAGLNNCSGGEERGGGGKKDNGDGWSAPSSDFYSFLSQAHSQSEVKVEAAGEP